MFRFLKKLFMSDVGRAIAFSVATSVWAEIETHIGISLDRLDPIKVQDNVHEE